MKALSLDIGAGSGRLLAIDYDGESFIQEEMYRFPNGMIAKQDGQLVWNLEELLHHVVKGIGISKAKYPQIATLGIDTWAVDYVRLDNSERLPATIDAYRSPRFIEAQKQFLEKYSYDTVYSESGIQNLPFNTIYQLFNDAQCHREVKQVLLVPDAIAFYLTKIKRTEVTNLSTTALYNPVKREISDSLMRMVGFKKEIFPPLTYPGDYLGRTASAFNFEGGPLSVITVASHDTASAVAGCRLDERTAFLSLGTWALLGAENDRPIINSAAEQLNFTNEIGVSHRVRFLKNLTGLFVIQELVKDYNLQYGTGITYQTLEEQLDNLRSANDFYIDIEDSLFKSPGQMLKKIKEYADKTGQMLPQSLGEIVRSVYLSMALSYRRELENLRNIIHRPITRVMVIGGGAKSIFLLRTLAEYLQVEIVKGHEEATALGNSLVQLVYQGLFKNMDEARHKLKSATSDITYTPQKAFDDMEYRQYKKRTGN